MNRVCGMRPAFLFFLFLVIAIPGGAQGEDIAFISKISIQGNKKTKRSVILRELPFAEGDTILVEELDEVLERSEQLVLNTGLFNKVSFSFLSWEGQSGQVHLQVTVEEAWYLYPVPVFELADRNFNVWWVEQNRSLDRVNYGVEFTHLNTTGRRDPLKFGLRFGYTRNYFVNYSFPYLNKKQTLGFISEFSFSENREVNYITDQNKQVFYRDEDKFIYRRWRAEGGITLRPGLRTNHLFVLSFRQNEVDDYIAKELNPDFFLDGRTRQRYFQIGYRYVFENRDVRPFPWKGNFFTFSIEKAGLGIFQDRNALTISSRYEHYFPFGTKWSLGGSIRTKVSLIRQQQPYNDNRAMGFSGNSLRGYEYYIIDGLDMAILKTSLRFQLFESEVRFGKWVPISAFRNMSLKLFLALNNDVGYANGPFVQENNPFNNIPLWGGGLGLNLVLFYDKVLKLEYSFNHLLENGLFLHFELNI